MYIIYIMAEMSTISNNIEHALYVCVCVCACLWEICSCRWQFDGPATATASRTFCNLYGISAEEHNMLE